MHYARQWQLNRNAGTPSFLWTNLVCLADQVAATTAAAPSEIPPRLLDPHWHWEPGTVVPPILCRIVELCEVHSKLCTVAFEAILLGYGTTPDSARRPSQLTEAQTRSIDKGKSTWWRSQGQSPDWYTSEHELNFIEVKSLHRATCDMAALLMGRMEMNTCFWHFWTILQLLWSPFGLRNLN